MTYNPDIHHRRSIRLRDYNYSSAGAYFVTIRNWNRECLFGAVKDGTVRLNDFGVVVDGCWRALPTYFTTVELDELVIMPNHVHGIIVLDANVGAQFIAPVCAVLGGSGRHECRPYSDANNDLNPQGDIMHIIKPLTTFSVVLTATILGLALLAGTSGASHSEGLTTQQGDAILTELRQIKQLLERQQRPQPPQQPQAPPTEPVKVKLPPSLFMGKADAPVTLVEFTDYQCPFCNRFDRDTLPELVKKYVDTGKVKFIPMDFPLDFHKNAMKAALATRCAGDQGKYWPMREALLKEPKAVEEGSFADKAKDVGLDEKQFQSCMDDQKHAATIKAMMDAAKSAGISGTPSFVIAPSGETLDGIKIVGAMPMPIFEEKIKDALGAGKR